MHVLVTGGTGFIGDALLPALLSRGDRVSVLSRSRSGEHGGVAYHRELESVAGDVDAIVNLAGASLAGKRWNADYKREIVDSRLHTTEGLGAWAKDLERPPSVVLSASAIGFYGPRGSEALSEDAPPGQGFSAQLCIDWEQAARRAVQDLEPQPRLCSMRLGVVLDNGGGAFTEMARPFRFGIANWIGDGHQWLSWVHRVDVVAAMLWLLDEPGAQGAYNLTAPGPVTSREFCQTMRRHYTTLPGMPMPAAVMRLMVGEMADELLLTGQRVLPSRLEQGGFMFSYPSLDEALREIRSGG